MGYKYRITAFDYPYKGWNDAEYQTKSFLKFVAKVIIWKFKYFGIDASVRNSFI